MLATHRRQRIDATGRLQSCWPPPPPSPPPWATRAWTYARSGNVLSIRFEGRRVHARVQGTEEEPYKVKLWLDTLSDEDWGYVLEALGQKARWSAQLLAGIMPADIESSFAATAQATPAMDGDTRLDEAWDLALAP